MDERRSGKAGEQGVVSIGIPITVPSFLFWVENVRLSVACGDTLFFGRY